MKSETQYENIVAVDSDATLGPGNVDATTGLMRSPGQIDLSHLKFHAINYEDGATPTDIDHTILDIAIFKVPLACTEHPHCDFSTVGVGKRTETDETASLSLCHNNRLHIDKRTFQGLHTHVKIPLTGKMEEQLKDSILHTPKGGEHYEVFIANCHEQGREIHVDGRVLYEFNSIHKMPYVAPEPSRGDPPYTLVSISTVLLFCSMFLYRYRVKTNQSMHAFEREGYFELVSNGEPV